MNGRTRLGTALTAVVLGALLPLVGAGAASAEVTYVPISGAGSTWSANAITQWTANVKRAGMTVQYASSGSSDGRNQFKNNTVDFGVSEIPYGLTDGGVLDELPTRAFAYMPIVAGGTSFMYNLTIAGKRVTQLRLSGQNLTKIFTGVITNWSDPALKADNPGLNLPPRRIVPVVRSDGSGTTAQFTRYMSKAYQSLWDAYCVSAGRQAPCGQTSQYPTKPGSGFVAQALSTGVAGYVAQSSSEGAITYVEYSYALNAGFPVVKVLNNSGYYVSPTASNVAVGLTGAKINADLTQNLDGVYGNADKRAYPLSSYSYMIVPTAVDTSGGSFSAAKGATLGAFAYYFLCDGQKSADVLGYSPLPVNLVKAGLEVVRKIPGVVAQNINISSCRNPTFSSNGTNTLAVTAPQPPACDKQGATQCGTAAAGTTGGTTGGTTTGGTAGGTTTGGTTTGGAAGGGTAANGAAGTGGGAAAGGAGGGAVGQQGAGLGGAGAVGGGTAADGDTGAVLASGGGTTNAIGQQVLLAADYTDSGLRSVLMVMSVLALLGAAFGPPLISRKIAEAERGP